MLICMNYCSERLHLWEMTTFLVLWFWMFFVFRRTKVRSDWCRGSASVVLRWVVFRFCLWVWDLQLENFLGGRGLAKRHLRHLHGLGLIPSPPGVSHLSWRAESVFLCLKCLFGSFSSLNTGVKVPKGTSLWGAGWRPLHCLPLSMKGLDRDVEPPIGSVSAAHCTKC